MSGGEGYLPGGQHMPGKPIVWVIGFVVVCAILLVIDLQCNAQ